MLILPLEGLRATPVSRTVGCVFPESHENLCPCGIYIWSLDLPFYFLDFLSLYPSIPITVATIHLLLEAFLNCSRGINPSFCEIALLCSFSFYSSNTYLSDICYVQGLALGSGCKKIKKIKILISSTHSLIVETKGTRVLPLKESKVRK